MPFERHIVCIDRSVGARKRQEHQRILQPLRLVNRHDLHQTRIAFEPQLPRIAARIGALIRALFVQIANQRVLAVKLRTGLLQQLGQMQQVSQHAFAVDRRARCLSEQPLRHVEIVEQAAQHRQHAFVAPAVAVVAEPQHALLPRKFVAVEGIKRGPIESERRGGQCRAHQAAIIGVRTRREPVMQFLRFPRLKHRIPIGQVDAAHAAFSQRGADRARFRAVVDQHRHMARLQWCLATSTFEGRLAGLPQVQKAHHLGRATGGHLAQIRFLAERLAFVGGGQPPRAQRRHLRTLDAQRVFTACCVGGNKWKRIGAALGAAEKERPFATLSLFGCFEATIDSIHHSLCRTEVFL